MEDERTESRSRLQDGLRPPWLDSVRSLRAFEFAEKYRKRIVNPSTGLPFPPTQRSSSPMTVERLAFETGWGLRVGLKIFLPFCATAFLGSFWWDIHGLIRSCSVAGMIGFGTNWFAIKMLFWPREPRPIFGYGLIPSQRQQLIDKVADEVLNNLINEELIFQKIEETRIVQRFSDAALEKLRQVVKDPEFTQDMRRLVLTYIGELAADTAFRDRMVQRAAQSLEDFGGASLRGWLVRKLKDVWRAPLTEIVESELERLDTTLDEGLEQLDDVLERLPAALEARQSQLETILTTMVVGMVREVDIREIVLEQLSTVTTEQLEQGFREFSDDKLSYITLLGGLLGLIGGTVIIWPVYSALALVGVAATLGLLDIAIYPLMRSRYWPRNLRFPPQDADPEDG